MQLRSIEIANFLSFREAQTVAPLGSVNAIIGANNVGKSNFFEAVRLVTESSDRIQNMNASVNEGLFHGGDMRLPIRIRAGIALTAEDWDAIPKAGEADLPVRLEHEIEYSLVASQDIIGSTQPSLNVKRRLSSGAQAGPNDTPSNLIHVVRGAVLHVPSQRRLQAESVGGNYWASPRPFDGAALKTWLNELASGRSVRDQRREAAFQADLQRIAGFERLTYKPVVNQGTHEVLIGDEGGFRARLEECGAGVQAVFIVLAAVHQGRIVLIDDVEASLHPAAQETFARTVAERVTASGGQVIFATHSPSILDAVPEEQIFEIRKRSDRSLVHSPAGAASSLIHTLRDLGYRPSLLRMANTVLFVEGPSDEAAVRAWWRTLFGEVPEPSVAIFSLGGSNFTHLSTSSLDALGRRCFALLDSDRPTKNAELDPKLVAFKEKVRDRVDVHVFRRRALENYFHPSAVAAVMNRSHPVSPVGPYDRFSDWVPDYGKARDAGPIAARMTRRQIPREVQDFLERVRGASISD